MPTALPGRLAGLVRGGFIQAGIQASVFKIGGDHMRTTARSAYWRTPIALKLSVSATALMTFSALAAQAQTSPPAAAQTAQASSVEEIVVTGSRITQSGFTTPTPVTVVTAEQLTSTQALVSDALNQLPSLTVGGGQSGGIGTGGSGFATVDLRALGPVRTLILLDGRRFVPQNGNGQVDTSLMPTALISRVDIVTGGASAAYGSDAVAGVVNYVLDKKFSGVKLQAFGGISALGDRVEHGVTGGAGAAFAADRGHFLTAFEYYHTDGLGNGDRQLSSMGCTTIANPGAGPKLIVTCGTHLTAGNPAGLIISGPLKGITFDPNGAPVPFQYGTYVGTNNQLGGDGVQDQAGPQTTQFGQISRGNIFNRGSFEVTDTISLFAENLVAWTTNHNTSDVPYQLGSSLAFLIPNDNAYLSPTVKTQMAAAKITNFRLGKISYDLPNFEVVTNAFTWRPTFGADFKIGTWSGEVYFQHGYNDRVNTNPFQNDQLKFRDAVDAVVAPAGIAGVVGGTIVCRTTLTKPTNGCIPYNIFGENNASQAAKNYVTTTTLRNEAVYKQEVVEGSVNGPVIEDWAGTISAAAGVGYRKENIIFTSDPYSQIFNPVTGLFGGYRAGSALPYSGKFDVKEGFGEVEIPLAKEQVWAQSLNANAAVRITNYSYSGTVTTWKGGLTYYPFNDLLLRGTRSRDIRAPTLNDLFAAGAAGTTTLTYKGIQYGGVKTQTSGNPGLHPEIANTTVLGGTYQPSWFDGLNLSVDYHDININGAIATPNSQTLLDQCSTNPTTPVCVSFLGLDPVTGGLLSVRQQPQNVNVLKTSGWDFEVSYRTPLADWFPVFGDGNMTFRALASRLNHYREVIPGLTPTDTAGEVTGSTPRWRGTGQVNFNREALSFLLQMDYVSGGAYSNAYVEGIDINKNHFGSYVKWSTRVGYKVMDGLELYANVNNLLDRRAPIIPALAGTAPPATNRTLYDIVGRYFRLGFRYSY